MGRRREGREAAVQYLFAHEIQPAADAAGDEGFWSLHMAKKGARAYAEELIKGVLAHLPEIDRCIEGVVENYRMERLAAVDRNILRVAVYELNHLSDAPPPVVINEAIEIAKKFGATESGGFVNGILDRVMKNNKAAGAEVRVAEVRASEPQSLRATEPQNHRTTESQSHRATEPQSLRASELTPDL